jgi:hypothetical protein
METEDKLKLNDEINKVMGNVPRPVTPLEMVLVRILSRCACNVAGCDPSGVPECSKGIRERRALP